MNKTTKILYQNRNCDNCGNDALNPLWQYEREVTARTRKWYFSVNNCICPDCGFVFVSPAPTNESLAAYYADSTTYFKIDYDISKRVNVIERHAKGGTYLELGAKEKSQFHQRLGGIFDRVITQELGTASSADLDSTDSIEPNTVDMVAHYFVLEHVPAVRSFLAECREMLKPSGVMIVEVPDLALYPDQIAALMLYEHTNHFTVSMLKQIAGQVGFELVEHSNTEASRPFGFSAVFRKVEQPIARDQSVNEYLANKASFTAGLEKVRAYQQLNENAHTALLQWQAQNKNVLLWGANANFDGMFSGRHIPADATIIDSDPRKSDYVDGHEVKTPEQAQHAIQQADAIVIYSGLWSGEILDTIESKYGKKFDSEHIIVVDYYFG